MTHVDVRRNGFARRYHLLFAFSLLLLLPAVAQAQVQPVWFEDFESQPRSVVQPGQRQTLIDGWHNQAGAAIDWLVHSGPTPAPLTGPAIDVEPGSETGKYMLALGWNQFNSTGILTGPLLDAAGLVDPTLEFFLHQHGATMGTLHVEVERELDAGSGAQTVAAGNRLVAPGASFGGGDVGTQVWILASQAGNAGRYTITGVISSSEVELNASVSDESGLDWSQTEVAGPLASYSDNEDNWYLRSHSLAATLQTGTGRFRPRFRAIIGTSHYSDMAIDGVALIDRGIDLGLSAIEEPLHGFDLGSEEVRVVLENHGTLPVSNVNLSLLLNGQHVATETYAGPLAPGNTDSHTFAAPVNLASVGNHTIRVQHFLPDDANPANDFVETVVRNAASVSTFPYQASFSSSAEQFFAGPTGGWQYGAVADWAAAMQPRTGFSTDLGGSGALGQTFTLYSPVFDLTGMSNPVLAFGHNFELRRLDRHHVDVSLDGGRTWSRLGSVGQGTNWYDDPLTQGFAGKSGTWRTATFPLGAFAAESEVALRFVVETGPSLAGPGAAIDAVIVRERDVDVGIVGFASPRTGCMLSLETATVEVRNYGTQSQSDIEIVLFHNGSEVARETYQGPLGPGATDVYSFAAPLNLAALGTHIIAAATDVPGDTVPGNDAYETSVAHLPRIESFPYRETFEGGDGDWVAEGSPSSWEHGRPFGQIIDGAAVGQRAWVTNRTGPYAPNELSVLHLPCFDLREFTQDPTLRFRYISDLEAGYDGVWLEASTDGGDTFSKVGSAGEGWYNDAANDFFTGRSDEGWQTARIELAGTAGEAELRLRFVLQSDSSIEGEGFAVDDVFLGHFTVDVGVVSINEIAPAPGLADETVSVTLRNFGTEAVSQIPVSLWVNGEQVAQETYSGSLAPGASDSFTFGATADLSELGAHTLLARTERGDDEDRTNDAATLHTRHLLHVTSLPYTESFEQDDGHWYAEGVNVSWQHGTPRRTFLGGAGHAEHAWATNLTGSYQANELSYLYTPSFDFTGLGSDPTLRFLHIFELDLADAHWLEVSTDGGENWSKLGAFGDGENWYTDDTTHVWTGTSGTSREWRRAELELQGLAGEADVRLRFVLQSDAGFTLTGVGIDAVSVAVGDDDVGVQSISGGALASDYDLDQETVEVTLRNHGSSAQSNFAVQLRVNGSLVATETYTGTLAGGSTDTFTFAAQADLSAEGRYVIEARTNLASDVFPFNDAAEIVVWHQSTVTSYPYHESFAEHEGGWVVGGSDPSWALGTPDKAMIRGAFSGERAFVTGGLRMSAPNDNEDSWVRGPRFDLSTLTDPEISLAVWWESEIGHDGAVLQVSTDGGATWEALGSVDSQAPAAHWYTYDAISSEPGGSEQGWSGTVAERHGSGHWLVARHRLVDATGASLAGEPDVRVRIAYANNDRFLHDGFAFDRVVVRDRVPSLDVEQPRLALPAEALPTVALPQTHLHVQTLRLEAVVNPQQVQELALTYTGSVPRQRIDAVRLWRDTSTTPGAFDPNSAVQLEFRTVDGSGRVRFTSVPSLSADEAITLHITADVAGAAAGAGTISFALAQASDVTVASANPVTALAFPLAGSEFLAFDLGRSPFVTDFAEPRESVLAEVDAQQRYPLRLDGGLEIGLDEPSLHEARVRLRTSYDGVAPVEGGRLAVIDFPNGPATGAVDVHLDLGERRVDSNRAMLTLRYALLGTPDAWSTNAYLSLDGGETWSLLLAGLEVDATGAWQTHSLDMTQPLAAAGVERLPSHTIVRLQASGTPGDALLLDAVTLEVEPLPHDTRGSGCSSTSFAGRAEVALPILLVLILMLGLVRTRLDHAQRPLENAPVHNPR